MPIGARRGESPKESNTLIGGVWPRSLLLVGSRWSRDGGVGAHVQASAHALAARGVRVTVLAGRVEQPGPARDVTLLASARLHDGSAAMRARVAEAWDVDADVVHIHQLDDPALVSFFQAKAPTVVSAHAYTACPAGLYYFQPGQACTRGRGPGCIANMVLRGCMHGRDPRRVPTRYAESGRALRALRGADLAISHSAFMDRYLAGNAVRRRAVVPLFATTAPPADGDEQAPGGVPAADEQALDRVLFAGRLVRDKGPHVLIAAMRELEAELIVCGAGREHAALRRLADELEVAERVRFRGWRDGDELACELAGAAVLALPSLWPEPFGLVGIEALSAGRPVVASDTGGVREWLDDGVTGTLVRPGDASSLARALGELLADPQRRRAMGAAGRAAVAARFSHERHVAGLLDAYRLARTGWLARR